MSGGKPERRNCRRGDVILPCRWQNGGIQTKTRGRQRKSQVPIHTNAAAAFEPQGSVNLSSADRSDASGSPVDQPTVTASQVAKERARSMRW